jgi:hypothetical protein
LIPPRRRRFCTSISSSTRAARCPASWPTRPVSPAPDASFGLKHDPVNVKNWSYRNDLAYRARLESQGLATAEFTVLVLDPAKSRTLTFLHHKRRLIAHLGVAGNAQGPLTVRLEPWGVVTGRLVDGRDRPLPGVRLRLDYPEQEFQTDPGGRFRVKGVVPGGKHDLTLVDSLRKGFLLSTAKTVRHLTNRAGEVKHLGNVRAALVPAGGVKG